MTEQLHLEPRHREQLEALLREHLPDVEVWAYGSRVSGQSHDGSDLDLVLRGPDLQEIEIGQLADFTEAIQRSTIPFLVEARDWARLPESFHREIEKKYVPISASLTSGPASMTATLTVESSEWQEFEFATLCDIKRGASPRPIHEWISEEGIPWVKIADASATNSRFIEYTKERIRPNGVAKSVSVFPGDLILSNSATPGIPRFVGIEACIHDGWLLLRDFRGIDKLFCYYLLLFEKPRLIRQGSGTVFTNLKTEILKRHRVKIPSLPEQRAIAHVLGTLDDKIELNRRMNETLEEMAQALFKSWFVDFDPVHAKAALRDHPSSKGSDWTVERARAYLDRMDPDIAALFPDRFVNSELGQIPEGWEVGTIDQLATVVGGTTPSTKNRSYWEGGTHYWATPKDLSTLSTPVLLRTERKITDAGLAKISSGLLPRGTVLLSSRAPIGYLAIAEIPVAINQGFIAIPPSRGVSNLFILYWSKASQEEIVNYANGSTFLEISKSNFRQLVLVLPRKAVMTAFEKHIRPLHDRVVSNERESGNLTVLRDALLPKLVSGEIRVGAQSVFDLRG